MLGNGDVTVNKTKPYEAYRLRCFHLLYLSYIPNA